MAVASVSTTAPTRRLLPRRGPDGRFARLAPVAVQAEPAPADVQSADEVLDDMARELDRQGTPREPLLPAESTTASLNAGSGLSRGTAPERAAPGAPVVVMTPTTLRGHDNHEGVVMTTMPVCLTHTADPVSMMDTPVGAVTDTTLRCRHGNDAVCMAHTPVCVTQTTDPAFAAIRAFDRVVAEWDVEFAEYLGIMDALDPGGRRCWDDPQAVARAVLGPIAGSTVAALDRLLRRMEALDARHEVAEARLLSTRAASEIGAAALRAAVRRYARRPFGWRTEETIMLERLAA